MGTRIRHHIRSNVVGYIAIFLFAMSGTAFGLAGSQHRLLRRHRQRQEVRVGTTSTMADVGIADIGTNAVGSGGAQRTASVKSAEINDGTIGHRRHRRRRGQQRQDPRPVRRPGPISPARDSAATGSTATRRSSTGRSPGSTSLPTRSAAATSSTASLSGPDIAGGLASAWQSERGGGHARGRRRTDVASTTVYEREHGPAPDRRGPPSCRAPTQTRGRRATSTSTAATSACSTRRRSTTSARATRPRCPWSRTSSSLAPGAHTVTLNCISLSGTVVKDDAAVNAIVIP